MAFKDVTWWLDFRYLSNANVKSSCFIVVCVCEFYKSCMLFIFGNVQCTYTLVCIQNANRTVVVVKFYPVGRIVVRYGRISKWLYCCSVINAKSVTSLRWLLWILMSCITTVFVKLCTVYWVLIVSNVIYDYTASIGLYIVNSSSRSCIDI